MGKELRVIPVNKQPINQHRAFSLYHTVTSVALGRDYK